MSGTEREAHWEAVHSAKRPEEVSWYEAVPRTSLCLIDACTGSTASGILDVGGGSSRLVDALLVRGFEDVTVLDIAPSALRASALRLGSEADRVTWLTSDVTRFRPARRWDVWHDRAVFHFLNRDEERGAYVRTLRACVRPGGYAIIATFAPDGPERCSGLPVQRYTPRSLRDAVGDGWSLETGLAVEHTTPGGVRQAFTYALLCFDGPYGR